MCLRTDVNNQNEILWDMIQDFSRKYEGLNYNYAKGEWMWPIVLKAGDVVTCNYRVCLNRPGNDCERMILEGGFAVLG